MRNIRKKASFQYNTAVWLGIALLTPILAGCTQEPAAVDRKEQLRYGRKMVSGPAVSSQNIQEDAVISSEPITGTQAQMVSPQRMVGDPGTKGQLVTQGQARPPQTLEEQLANVHSGRKQPEDHQAVQAQHSDKQQVKQAATPLEQKEAAQEDDLPPELMALQSKEEKQHTEHAAGQTKSKPHAQAKSGYKIATPMNDLNYTWPAHGRVLSRFKHGKNEGINIALGKGASIAAAADGEVVYVGDDSEEYGKMLIVRHAGNIFTAYAHADKIVVTRGVKVRKGQVIATAGQSGSVSSPQLYFSVRKDDDTIDPEASF